jgi:localization factor PodJL
MMQALAESASRGDANAQYNIALRLMQDASIPQNAAAAARWLIRAATQGHVDAQFVLATLYERGLGVEQDTAAAAEWYTKAARAGHVRAMHNLAVLRANRGTAQDYREASIWFARAANAGFSDSQYNLAQLYLRGLGVEPDRGTAYFWFRVAESAGDKEARRQADLLKPFLSKAIAETLEAKARAWQASANHSGSGTAGAQG